MFDVLEAWRGIKGFEMVGEGETEEAKLALSLDRVLLHLFGDSFEFGEPLFKSTLQLILLIIQKYHGNSFQIHSFAGFHCLEELSNG